MKKNIVAVVVALVVVGGGSFYAGMNYEKGVASQAGAARFGGAGNGNGFAGGTRGARSGGGGVASGEILSIDATSITLKLRDGGSRIIFFSSTTPVTKSVSGSAQDLKVGEEVMVIGPQNTDGSVGAQSIQIRPASPKINTTP